jgi:hypothetical protein
MGGNGNERLFEKRAHQADRPFDVQFVSQPLQRQPRAVSDLGSAEKALEQPQTDTGAARDVDRRGGGGPAISPQSARSGALSRAEAWRRRLTRGWAGGGGQQPGGQAWQPGVEP